MRTFITKLSTISVVTFALLLSGCSGITDANLDEDDRPTTKFEISNSDNRNGDGGSAGTHNDDSEPEPLLPTPESDEGNYDDDDGDGGDE